jgi:hypothetical protein
MFRPMWGWQGFNGVELLQGPTCQAGDDGCVPS